MGAAAPGWVDSDRRLEQAQSERVLARVEGAAAALEPRPGEGAARVLASPFGLRGAAVLDARRVVLAQAGELPALEVLAARCPRNLLPGQGVRLLAPELPGVMVACAGLDRGGALLGLEPVQAGGRQPVSLLLLMLALGSMAAGLSAAAVRQALSPLAGMADAARRLAQGEVGVQVPPADDAELRPLAASLNQLATALQARDDEIRNRLSLTRQLAALVAHEVRNPLQSLTMLADVVAHEDDPEVRKALLESIRSELHLIGQVVTRLVSDGDQLTLVVAPVPLEGLVRRCVYLHLPRARELGVELSASGGAAVVGEVDAALLRRALENLVENAISLRGAAGGGRVHIALEPLDGPPRAVLHVDDDGVGVPEEDRQRIFLPGVSGREGGTGLGLALARKVAEAHGGALTVGPSPLGGARFTLVIPLLAR